MGAWGEGVFENDVAGDWADRFEGNPPTSIVAKAVAALGKAKQPDFDVCSVALAAAEVIAGSRGRPCPDLPASIKIWIMKREFRADDALARQAAACLDRIESQSELAELWEHASTWRRGLAGLRKRLGAPAQEPRYRAPVAKSAAGAGFKAAKAFVEKQLHGRLTTPKGAEMYLRFHGELTDGQFLDLLERHGDVLLPIRTLELTFSGISNRTLENLHRLPNLAVLYLRNSSVTDAGMACLRNLPELRELELACTKVSDRGLRDLADAPKLECLALGKTKVTPAGIEEFQRRKPRCYVGPTWEWAAHRRKLNES